MARDFDYTNPDYIDFGDPSYLDITGDITLSLWICCPTGGIERKAVAKWADAGDDFSYLLSILADGTAQWVVNTDGNDIANGTTDLDDGEWHHVAGIYELDVEVRVYVEGLEEDSTGASGSITSNPTTPVRIGAGSGGSGTEQPFDGEIGHVAIWDVALTDQEIASLAAGVSPLQIRRNNLVFYAPLNGQSPEPDVVGGASGTVTGTTVVEEPPIPHSIVAPW